MGTFLGPNGPGPNGDGNARITSASPAPGGEAAGLPLDAGGSPRLTRRVLVVDDNIHSAESLAQIIKLWGHDSRMAFSGPEAIRSAREYGPDVILLDIGLPGMDGCDVARVLRNDPRCRGAVLLAMTGYDRDEDRQRVRESGFDRHLVKPLELDALEALLAQLATAEGPDPSRRG
jgi:CheY-like chemotaxis protein